MTRRFITNAIILSALAGGMILAKDRVIESADAIGRYVVHKAAEAERIHVPQGIGTLGIRG